MATVRSRVSPVPDKPAATIDTGNGRAVAIADYHAGIEAGLRYERGVELPSNAAVRLDRVLELIDDTGADRLIVLGDLGHRIGNPAGAEETELDDFVSAVTARVPLSIATGNHDGGIADRYATRERVTVHPSSGGTIGGPDNDAVGLIHGHTWPDRSVLSAEVICMGHEHPEVRLKDSVGGTRTAPVWLRGRLDRELIAAELDTTAATGEASLPDPEVVVFPAFNDRSGGTWINVPGQGFLSPFLPEALVDGEAYLLDGTRLGDYEQV